MAKRKNKDLKYIFVVGGVMSSVGKGIAASSIAKLLQARGYNATAFKIDPYVNVDAGTMNPTEHGEVFVLSDGTECDMDMGNYERYLEKKFSRDNYMTTGSIYQTVINKERNLEFEGRCVHVVPDIPLAVIEKINKAAKNNEADVALVEIGGTIGDYQNILFLEAYRLLKFYNPYDTLLVLVSYLPALSGGGNELKTKPTQHAIKNLNSAGLHPDVIIGRAKVPLDEKRKEKLEFMCGLEKGSVISAPDVKNIYEVPLNFERDGLDEIVLKKLNLRKNKLNLSKWKRFVNAANSAQKEVKIGIVGKYFDTGEFVLEDAYVSVIEAIKHAGYTQKLKPIIEWINAGDFEPSNSNYKQNLKSLKKYNGVIVPGGFGARGIEGKIQAIKYCRENKIPYFGLCYGMQLAVVEYARHVLGYKNAHTTEIDPETEHPVIDIMPEQKQYLAEKQYGATMRLGSYNAELAGRTISRKAYRQAEISERHRHRYEVNPEYISELEKAGIKFAGKSKDGVLMEIMELPQNKHPFFVGTQFHPEFQSYPMSPHPLFKAFMKAADQK